VVPSLILFRYLIEPRTDRFLPAFQLTKQLGGELRLLLAEVPLFAEILRKVVKFHAVLFESVQQLELALADGALVARMRVVPVEGAALEEVVRPH